MRDAVDHGHGGVADMYSDTCSDDNSDDNDVNSDYANRDDDMLDNNDDPIEKIEANTDFQKKIDAFKANGCTFKSEKLLYTSGKKKQCILKHAV